MRIWITHCGGLAGWPVESGLMVEGAVEDKDEISQKLVSPIRARLSLYQSYRLYISQTTTIRHLFKMVRN